ncbi:hypothetical protein [Actinopolyspora halophila]|uniref:hypothetical protein n=1 Tax=Actinopolyspora halophila TaxID=1850 RepID=UPI00039A6F18|nr:hypothetical protein [Actinopolyspora halophila]
MTAIFDDEGILPDTVDHRLIGTRVRPRASDSVFAKSVAAGENAGLTTELAETLAHAAADHQQLRKALGSPKVQRFGTEAFHYIEVDVLNWTIVPSPDNIRFEGEHARNEMNMPRFGSIDGQPLLTFAMESSTAFIEAMTPRIRQMLDENPHIQSVQDRGIETPGWLSFLRITTELGITTRLETTDCFARTVATHQGLDLKFADVVWNLHPGSRRASNLHRDIVNWATCEDVTPEQARKVRCAIMPNARVIIKYEGPRAFDRARRRLVAHLHLAPPLPFTIATSLNTKANAAVDSLYERGLLPVPEGMTPEGVREILDGTTRQHDLLDDELAVLACASLNPHHSTRAARTINDAIADLTGVKTKLEDRRHLASEVALRGLPADQQLTGRRSALDRAWHWSVLRRVALTRQSPLVLLNQALPELLNQFDVGPATAELTALASYHLVVGPTPLLARSKHGGQSNNTEPHTILKRLAQSDAGLRQLCQIILDGRAGRQPQLLEDGALPSDRLHSHAEPLTNEKIRELTRESESPPITHKPVEEQFTDAIANFQNQLDDVRSSAEQVASIVGPDSVPLVETRGYDSEEVKATLDKVNEMVSDWRSARRRADRLRRRAESVYEEDA